MIRNKLILTMFCASLIVQAEESKLMDTSDIDDEIEWEKILDMANQDEDNSSYADEIAQLGESPVDLNTSTKEELCRVPMITNLIALRIVEKRRIKSFTNISELLDIRGITPEMFNYIRNYVKIRKIGKSVNINGSFTSRISSEIEKRYGFINRTYLGSPLKSSNKFYLSVDNKDSSSSSVFGLMEYGLTTDKDPGETNLTNYLSGYGSLFVKPILTNIIIGDYHVETAEGLIFWRAPEYSKGSEVIASVHKNGSGAHPHLSTDENHYFRGFALNIKTAGLQLQLMYSNKLINAKIDSLGRISSIDKTGMFRTEYELQKKNTSREKMFGYRIIINLKNGFRIGGTGYTTLFSNSLIIEEGNNKSTDHLSMQGIDLSYNNEYFEIFSEYAVDLSKRTALICGITYEPITAFAITVLARDYSPLFQSIYGNSFGECQGKIQNETGVYFGTRLSPFSWFCISMYYDQFRNPRSTQSIPASSNGNDFLSLAQCKVTKEFMFDVQFKRKDVPIVIEEYDVNGHIVKTIRSRLQSDWRVESNYLSSPSVCFASRAEWTLLDYQGAKGAEKGSLMSQSVKWMPAKLLTLKARLTVFQTDSYDSRLYELEEDLPYIFSNPALFGKGVRWYCIFKYQLSSYASIGVKYSQIFKDGVMSIGNDLDEIKGDTKSEVSVQLYVRF